MKTITQILDALLDVLDEYVPAIISVTIYLTVWICLFPVRILACLLFPYSANYPYHPMHKYKSFWMFGSGDK